MDDPVSSFWHWFLGDAAKWSVPAADEDDFDDEKTEHLLITLSEIFPELSPTFSWTPGEPFEIQFSAKLRPSMAPLIRRIVEAAPVLESWRFIAFQPPLGFHDLYVGHLGLPYLEMPVADILVQVVDVESPCSLRVYVPRFDANKRWDFDTAVRLILEEGMGEAWLLEQLGSLALADVSEAPESAFAITDLPSRFSDNGPVPGGAV